MKRRPTWMSLSLALNVVLLAALAAAGVRREIAGASATGDVANPAASSANLAPVTRSPRAVRVVVDAAAPFHWSQIQTTNYADLAANLRAIHCPPATIRDIVGGAIERDYRRSIRSLTDPLSAQFWDLVKPPLQKKRIEQAFEEVGRVWEEMEDLGKELGKAHWRDSRSGRLHPNDRNALGFLSEEKQRQVRDIRQRDLRLEEEADEDGVSRTREEIQRRRELLALQREADIANLLTPEELAEYNARHSDGIEVREGLYEGGFSPEELQAMARWRAEASAQTRKHSQDTPEDRALVAAAQKEAEGNIRELLGPGRFADYERGNDPGYQQTRAITDRLGLPTTVALELHEERQRFETAATRLRTGAGTDAEVLKQNLSALRAEAEAAARRRFDAQGWDLYREHSAGWLDNAFRPGWKE